MDVLAAMRICAVLSACVLLLALPRSGHAASPVYAATSAPLLELKFAYINNFTRFVTWPPKTFASETSPFTACVMGSSAVSEAFEKFAKTVESTHVITTRRVKTPRDAESCHFVYFDESADPALAKRVLKSVADEPVLTIGDSVDFVRNGGIIRFMVVERKLAFEVNSAVAKHNGFTVSSKLLKLARSVRD